MNIESNSVLGDPHANHPTIASEALGHADRQDRTGRHRPEDGSGIRLGIPPNKDHVTPAILREAGPAVRLDFGPVRDVAIQALKGRSEARFSDDAYGARRGGCVRPTREANEIEEIGGLDSVRARRFLRVNSLRAHR